MDGLPNIFASKKPIGARLLSIALLIVPWAHAQSALTPEEAVRLALERPDVVAAIEAEIDLARSELVAARTWPNPEISVERTAVSRPRTEPDETGFMLSQQFELGGRRGLQRRAAELGISAAEAGAVAARQQARLEVLQRYYTLVAAERRADAQRARIAALEELARVAARRTEAGDLSGYQSQRIRHKGALARTRLEEVEATRHAARERLAGLIGVDGSRVTIAERIDLLPAANRLDGESADDGPANGPADAELVALDARRNAAAAAARAAGRPSVPLTLGVGQRRFDGPAISDDALVLQFSVPLPLFDRNQAARARAQAESQRAESRYRIHLVETRARRDAIRAEAGRLTAAASRLRTEVVPQAEALTRIARASFAEGELGLVGLLAALDAEIEAVDRSLDLQHRARMAWIELERLTQADSSPHGELP